MVKNCSCYSFDAFVSVVMSFLFLMSMSSVFFFFPLSCQKLTDFSDLIKKQTLAFLTLVSHQFIVSQLKIQSSLLFCDTGA